jgi:DNA-binding response OmpR family regulator
MAYRILVIEDEAAFADVLSETLSDEGYSVVHVPNPLTALDMLAAGSYSPDAVVCDVRLPGLSGDRLAAEVRRRFPQRRLPILLLSASPNPHTELPNVWFMQKPFDIGEFLATIRRLVDYSRPTTGSSV